MARCEQTYFSYRSPYGPLTIGVTDDAVSAVVLGEIELPGRREPSEIANDCANQLQEYFVGKRSAFDVPIALRGSDFQVSVWEAMLNVPYGQVRTTREIAESIGKPSSFRMVGSAVRDNPLAIIVPAHRIVGSNGKVLGNDLSAKRRAAFLDMERRNA